MRIGISHYAAYTRVLGPYGRSAVWVRGCPFSCAGCLSPEMRDFGGELADCRDVADILAGFGAEGVTVSGGEPFAQAGAVARVIELVRERMDYGVIIYSGYTLKELSELAGSDAGAARLLSMTDVLIDGRYVAELDDGRPYRGSSNQRIIGLTDRYASVLDSYYSEPGGRKTEINIGPEGVTLTGVPSAEAFAAWERMKRSRGPLAQGAPHCGMALDLRRAGK